jgi:3-deoxy-D-manno-octulosonic-acid transferase
MLAMYNVLLTLYFIITLPYYAVQMIRREKYRAGLRQRLGIYRSSLLMKLRQRKRMWIHAVSVGEVLAVMPLLKLLRESLPDWYFILSTVTLTGQKIAKEKAGQRVIVTYFPLDFRFAVRRALQFFAPSLIILVETELWPNFISTAAVKRIPIAMVNGRISDRSYARYRHCRFFLKNLLARIDLFCMQSELDTERIRRLGALPEKVKTTGNMKFDSAIEPCTEIAGREVAANLGIDPQRPIIVAGSTHKGEDEILLDALRVIREKSGDTVLIIVPRHPERAGEIKALASARGEEAILRSQLHNDQTPHTKGVLIVDRIGELVDIYRTATVVFVGKSLVEGGGQNVIEPATMGKPVIFGPHMENFREAAELLIQNRGAIQVRDAAEFKEKLLFLLQNREEREQMGRRAAATMARSRGATIRNLRLISELLLQK